MINKNLIFNFYKTSKNSSWSNAEKIQEELQSLGFGQLERIEDSSMDYAGLVDQYPINYVQMNYRSKDSMAYFQRNSADELGPFGVSFCFGQGIVESEVNSAVKAIVTQLCDALGSPHGIYQSIAEWRQSSTPNGSVIASGFWIKGALGAISEHKTQKTLEDFQQHIENSAGEKMTFEVMANHATDNTTGKSIPGFDLYLLVAN